MKNVSTPAEDPRDEQKGVAQLAFLAAQLYAGKADPPPSYSFDMSEAERQRAGRFIGVERCELGYRRMPRKGVTAKGSE
jgi:hypothetical protein